MENYDFDSSSSKTRLPSAGKQILLTLLVMSLIAFGLWFFFGTKGCKTNSSATNTPTPEANPTTPPKTQGTLIRLHGSNTVGKKLAPELIKAFLRQQGATSIDDNQSDKSETIGATINGERVDFQIAGTGTMIGFKNLNEKNADGVLASREIAPDEINMLKSGGFGDMRASKIENVVAMDGVAVIVNTKSKVKDLSRSQIAEIFKGNITNWSDLGYPSGDISLYIRDLRSASADMFKETILAGSNPTSSATQYEDATELVNNVANDPNGIGFVSWATGKENPNVRAIGIRDENTATVSPSESSIATEAYMLSRRLFIYTPPNGDPKKKTWLDKLIRYAMSSAGQQTAQRAGFVPLDPISTGNITTEISDKYRQAVRNAIRTNVVLRFKTGSSDLDAKALNDLERLKTDARYQGKQFALVGFTDNVGSEPTNIGLSLKRAQTVEAEMRKRGLTVASVAGLGSSDPVRDNSTELNRALNRRVDVWFK